MHRPGHECWFGPGPSPGRTRKRPRRRVSNAPPPEEERKGRSHLVCSRQRPTCGRPATARATRRCCPRPRAARSRGCRCRSRRSGSRRRRGRTKRATDRRPSMPATRSGCRPTRRLSAPLVRWSTSINTISARACSDTRSAAIQRPSGDQRGAEKCTPGSERSGAGRAASAERAGTGIVASSRRSARWIVQTIMRPSGDTSGSAARALARQSPRRAAAGVYRVEIRLERDLFSISS